MASLIALRSIRSRGHRVIGSSNFGEAGWAPYNGSVARQTENWLRAAIYVITAATSTQLSGAIRRRLLHW